MLDGGWVKMVNFIVLWWGVAFCWDSICRNGGFLSHSWQMLTRNDHHECTKIHDRALSPVWASSLRRFPNRRGGSRTYRTIVWIVCELRGTWFCWSTSLGEHRGGGIGVTSLFLCLRNRTLWSGRLGWVTLISYVEVLYKMMKEDGLTGVDQYIKILENS